MKHNLDIQKFGGRGQVSRFPKFNASVQDNDYMTRTFGKPQKIGLRSALYHANEKHTSPNCQRCVVAVEERLRGYDVEAKQNVTEEEKNVARKWNEYYVGQQWYNTGARREADAVKKLEEQIDKFGNESRGIVYVVWKDGRSAHVFNYVKSDGKIIYLDGQSKRVKNIANTLASAQVTKTLVSRVDNLEINEAYADMVIQRRRKNAKKDKDSK